MRVFFTVCCLLILSASSIAQQSIYFKSNHKKSYSSDCNPCGDPWVGEVFYKVWGTCPATLGWEQGGFCNIKQWNNGSWNSKSHLESIIFNKFTQRRQTGRAYIFIKPENVAGLGHIGWGFMLSDGSFYAGATENYYKGNAATAYWVNAGADNEFWAEMFLTEQKMFEKMKTLGYSEYKSIPVNYPNIAGGKRRADEVMMKGFQGISNNCLDHTYQVLEAYGVKNMPWRQTNPTPNGWFKAFYHNTTKGGYYL